jgi:hypothetical protein
MLPENGGASLRESETDPTYSQQVCQPYVTVITIHYYHAKGNPGTSFTGLQSGDLQARIFRCKYIDNQIRHQKIPIQLLYVSKHSSIVGS